ncbi:YwgA family protein [Alkalihalobacterium chitinilyticum]|uniref:YwgA family protein n=1 Tax=Alkalihalobacterium chitinilyticum TaxID=2980103 RepID=A0ABT5VGR3_9BACI|nr:YwgA family protein [Alkalihalobacterium chitinilyticum]MDE5414649.1 YwgA family protein [Alkalihalobacterium chitinilyticum]
MLKEHVKLLSMFQQAGEIVGRKKLQKIVYISKKLDIPFSERFKFHMFGPYSEELTLRIEELCNLGFLQEILETKSGYQQYRYILTEEGEKFLDMYNLDLPNIQPCVSSMNGQSSRFLELVSTVLYFEEMEKEEIVEKVMTVKKKQNYTEEEMERAFTYIEQLKSVQH